MGDIFRNAKELTKQQGLSKKTSKYGDYNVQGLTKKQTNKIIKDVVRREEKQAFLRMVKLNENLKQDLTSEVVMFAFSKHFALITYDFLKDNEENFDKISKKYNTPKLLPAKQRAELKKFYKIVEDLKKQSLIITKTLSEDFEKIELPEGKNLLDIYWGRVECYEAILRLVCNQLVFIKEQDLRNYFNTILSITGDKIEVESYECFDDLEKLADTALNTLKQK